MTTKLSGRWIDSSSVVAGHLSLATNPGLEGDASGNIRVKVKPGGNIVLDSYGLSVSSPVTIDATYGYIPSIVDSTHLTTSPLYSNGTYIGLGTTSPSQKLDIREGYINLDSSSSSNGIFLKSDGTFSSGIQWYADGTYKWEIYRSGSDLNFYSGGVGGAGNIMTMAHDSGYIGIGTTAPVSKFHVKGDSTFTGGAYVSGMFDVNGSLGVGTTNPTAPIDISQSVSYMNIRNTSVNTGAWINIQNTGTLYIAKDNNNGNGFISGSLPFAGLITTTDARALVLGTNGSGRVYVTSGGNVGIGTTNPITKFDVVGNSFFNGDSSVSGNIRVDGTISTDSYSLPANDGLNGQVIGTNGAGVADWTSIPDPLVTLGYVTKEPTGFLNRTDSTLSLDGTVFTIAPTSSSFSYYIKGNKYTISGPNTVNIPDVDGYSYIYYDGSSLTRVSTFTPEIILDYAYVSSIYWDASANRQIYFGEERHGLEMDGATHLYLHKTRGARWDSGIGLNGFNIGGGGDASNVQFGHDSGAIWDEDIYNTIPEQAVPAQVPIYWRDGTRWSVRSTVDTFPFIYSGLPEYTGANGRLPYNSIDASYSGSLVQVGTNNYVLMHYYATNDLTRPFIGFQGQNEYTSAVDARTGAQSELINLQTVGMPMAETVAIATVIYQTGSYGVGSQNARIVVADTVTNANYVDWRFSGINGSLSSGNIGPTGATGLQGVTGIQGQTGVQGHTGIQGETGIQGQTGIQGTTGVQGETGVQGSTGIQGQTGIQGETGVAGETGVQGIQGETGIQGMTGIQGQAADVMRFKGSADTTNYFNAIPIVNRLNGDFYTITAVQVTDSSVVPPQTFYEYDEIVWAIDSTKWVQVGSQVLQGATGVQGPTGFQGVTGFQGLTGIQGEFGLQGSTGVKGSTGVQGQTGVQGSTGVQGIQGITGVKGETGVQGITGIGFASGTPNTLSMFISGISLGNSPFTTDGTGLIWGDTTTSGSWKAWVDGTSFKLGRYDGASWIVKSQWD